MGILNNIINFFKNDVKFAVGFVLFLAAIVIQKLILQEQKILYVTLYICAYFLISSDIIKITLKNIKKLDIFDENFLMIVASGGAFILGYYEEAVAVILFYKVGEHFQEIAAGNATRSIQSMLDQNADTAHLLKEGENTPETVDCDSVAVGSSVVVYPGEKVPLDGIVIFGNTTVNTSSLTGESVPRAIASGSEILAGYINGEGLIHIKTTKTSDDTVFARVIHLVKESASKKAQAEKFITKFARYYTPAVLFAAALVALIPPLFIKETTYSVWVYKALIFLVISCPCALVLSVPLSFFAGIGASAKKGIFVKGGEYLDAQSHIKSIVFDKTGTLTTGEFEVSKFVLIDGFDEKYVVEQAACAEKFSNHPMAKCVVKYYEQKYGEPKCAGFTSYKDVAGHGIIAESKDGSILVGSLKFAGEHSKEPLNITGDVVVLINGIPAGYFELHDEISQNADKVIKQLKNSGIMDFYLLSGDGEAAVKNVADTLDINHYKSQMLPADKLEELKKIISGNKSGKTAFVGDGVNDAPSLALADVGYAMGAGSHAAIDAGDVVLTNSDLSKLPEAIEISRFTRKIAYENIIGAIGIKVMIMGAGVIGIATMWSAIFADVGVAILTVFNSIRILRKY